MARRHWIAGLLVVSLSLNLLGAGALLARWAMGGPLTPMAWAVRDLDPIARERVHTALRGRNKDVVSVRQEFRQSQAEIKRLVSINPLDEAALAQALVTLRDVSQRYQLQLHNLALDVLPQLSTEQRRQAVHRLLRAGADHGNRQNRKPQKRDSERPPEPEQDDTTR